MLAPFTALLPRRSGFSYEDLGMAAKELRVDPANYQSVAGVEYERRDPALYRWEIAHEGGVDVVGLVGIFPFEELVPHEKTTAAALTRPRYPVQIRPVMALIDGPLPPMTAIGPPVRFDGTHHHTVTPVETAPWDVDSAVIADGHHRTAAARREGGDPGIMTMMVSTGDAALEAGAFHRVFAHPVFPPAEISNCTVTPEHPAASLAAGRISIATPNGAVGVEVERGAVPAPLLGIPAGLASRLILPALELAEEDAVYLDDLEAALAGASYGTAVLLPGSAVGSVVAAARTGLELPPKATRFRPKPIRGFLMRPL